MWKRPAFGMTPDRKEILTERCVCAILIKTGKGYFKDRGRAAVKNGIFTFAYFAFYYFYFGVKAIYSAKNAIGCV